MCDMYAVSGICSWQMTVIGCGVCVERLCVSRCQCVCCVDACVSIGLD